MEKPRKSNERGTDVSGSGRDATGRRAIHGNNDADYGDRVARRAYELYLERGRADGRDFEDWLKAERDVSTGDGSRE